MRKNFDYSIDFFSQNQWYFSPRKKSSSPLVNSTFTTSSDAKLRVPILTVIVSSPLESGQFNPLVVMFSAKGKGNKEIILPFTPEI